MIRWFTGIPVKRLAADAQRIEKMRELHKANIDVAIADRVAAVKTLNEEITFIERLR